MFPQINRIFRKKEIAQIETLKIPANSTILNNAEIDIAKLEKDTDGSILLETLQDKLNILGAHFAK